MENGPDLMLPRHEVTRHDLMFGALSLAIASAVFAVDMFTDIEGAVAVLYVMALLLAAQATNRRGLAALSGTFVALTLFAFFFGSDPPGDPAAFLRLAVALAALLVTTALLLRNDQARSELLRTNAALRESEERYRSIFDRTRVALWERDYSKVRSYLMDLRARGVSDLGTYSQAHPDFIAECMGMVEIVAANEAANDLLGTSTTHAPAGVMTGFISPRSPAMTSILQAIMDGARYFEDTVEVIGASGGTKSVLLSIGLPEDPLSFNRVIVSMIDITQREEARRALAEAQAELSRALSAATIGVLSASLAHELNQPLGAIGVNSQTLLRWLDRTPPDLEAARRASERILRDSNRASEIIRNTRAMLSAKPQESERIDLNTLVIDTLTLMEHDLQRERTTVDVIKHGELPPIPAIKVEMQQVLINLISNAVQAISAAAPRERLITVTLDSQDQEDFVLISVRDTGCGLGVEAKEKIFTPFFTTKNTGMGMGLSICRNTIEARGGSLTGRNHPDGGALFEIRLPKEQADA